MGLIISKIRNHNLICNINFNTKKYNLFGNRSKKKNTYLKRSFLNKYEYTEFKNFG